MRLVEMSWLDRVIIAGYATKDMFLQMFRFLGQYPWKRGDVVQLSYSIHFGGGPHIKRIPWKIGEVDMDPTREREKAEAFNPSYKVKVQ